MTSRTRKKPTIAASLHGSTISVTNLFNAAEIEAETQIKPYPKVEGYDIHWLFPDTPEVRNCLLKIATGENAYQAFIEAEKRMRGQVIELKRALEHKERNKRNGQGH